MIMTEDAAVVTAMTVTAKVTKKTKVNVDVGTNIKKPIFITLFKDFMNITTIIIGLLPITYGLYILSLRLRNKMDKLGKIESMKGFYGKKL